MYESIYLCIYLFNDALGHNMVKDHSDSERGNLLQPFHDVL